MNKNVALALAAILAFGLAAFFFTRDTAKPSFARMKAHGLALDTKQELAVEFGPSEPPPWVNPATGQRTVYPFWFCEKCKYKFVPQLEPNPAGGPPRVPMAPRCTHCGDEHVGSWIPEVSEPAAGTAPPPKWPA
jgi:hypothetical protein